MNKDLDNLLNSVAGFANKERPTFTAPNEVPSKTMAELEQPTTKLKPPVILAEKASETISNKPDLIETENKSIPTKSDAGKKRASKNHLPLFEVIPDADRRNKDYATVRIRRDLLKALKIFFDEKKQYIQTVEIVLVEFLNQNRTALWEKIRKHNPLG